MTTTLKPTTRRMLAIARDTRTLTAKNRIGLARVLKRHANSRGMRFSHMLRRDVWTIDRPENG